MTVLREVRHGRNFIRYGDAVRVLLPGQKTRKRCKFLDAEETERGVTYRVIDFTGKVRFVTPERVTRIRGGGR